MKILYGIQTTGHGHISRAKELLPELRKYATVDIMMSGGKSNLKLNKPVKYSKQGISFSYDSRGGISFMETLRELRPLRFINDIHSVPLSDYDLVVNDFEPVSAWSAKLERIPSIALSHQAAFRSPKTPRPAQKSLFAEKILQHFAPADFSIGFHFKRYDDMVEPPIIRSGIRNINIQKGKHITVYLPAYHYRELHRIFKRFSHVDWHIFSPSCSHIIQKGNVRIHPVSNKEFLESFASCCGVITSAGFETCAEAMYLGKKLLAIPIKGQYEQACNAAALSGMGVMILKSLVANEDKLFDWLENQRVVQIDEVADPKKIVQRILRYGMRVSNYKLRDAS